MKKDEDFIHQQFSKMSDEEAIEFVRNLRARRATPRARTTKKAKATAKKTGGSFITNFKKLSLEEQAALLKELKGE